MCPVELIPRPCPIVHESHGWRRSNGAWRRSHDVYVCVCMSLWLRSNFGSVWPSPPGRGEARPDVEMTGEPAPPVDIVWSVPPATLAAGAEPGSAWLASGRVCCEYTPWSESAGLENGPTWGAFGPPRHMRSVRSAGTLPQQLIDYRCRPNLANVRPTVVRHLAHIMPCLTRLCQILLDVCQSRSTMSQTGRPAN